MKVGILTFHYTCNYGGVLQAYALQKTIERLGCNVEIIDFVPSSYKKNIKYYLSSIRSFATFMKICISILHKKGLKCAFDDFRTQYLRTSKRINENELYTINDSYDAVIVGSDQVWNWNQHNQPVYFINWQPEFSGLRISYAPCCAVNKVANGCTEILKAALTKFSAISVRNEQTQMFVKDLINIEAPIVCDPTIFHSFNEFTSPVINCDYILVYILGKEIEGGNKKAVTLFKEKYPGCKVVGVQTCADNPQIMSWADKVIYNANPKDWVGLIANAKCVFTDSFHGTIFSMKYKRDFVCYYTEVARASRFLDMEKRYNIGSNIVRNVNELQNRHISDFKCPKNIEPLFENQIKGSYSFLKNSLR